MQYQILPWHSCSVLKRYSSGVQPPASAGKMPNHPSTYYDSFRLPAWGSRGPRASRPRLFAWEWELLQTVSSYLDYSIFYQWILIRRAVADDERILYLKHSCSAIIIRLHPERFVPPLLQHGIGGADQAKHACANSPELIRSTNGRFNGNWNRTSSETQGGASLWANYWAIFQRFLSPADEYCQFIRGQ